MNTAYGWFLCFTVSILNSLYGLCYKLAYNNGTNDIFTCLLLYSKLLTFLLCTVTNLSCNWDKFRNTNWTNKYIWLYLVVSAISEISCYQSLGHLSIGNYISLLSVGNHCWSMSRAET